jgi:hypothetical protein
MTRISLPLYAAHDIHLAATGIIDLLVGEMNPLNEEGTDQALDEAMAERETFKRHIAFLGDLADARDQAIDEFMAERAGFKARIAHLEGIQASQTRALTTLMEAAAPPPTVSILGAENAKLRSDVRALEDATIQAAGFIDSLRSTLKRLGVTFDTDELGMPRVSVNADELASWAYETHQAQRTVAQSFD